MKGKLRPVAKDAADIQCTNQLATWITDCIQNHPDCRPLNAESGGFLPTRLIEVGISDVRLVLTAEFPKRKIKYLALSHCWGDGVPETATTTLDTLGSWLLKVPFENLTPSFQDVCVLARRLGVPYVWIDSLCIIQDSLEDWTRESTLMGKVFSHSYCTIGAGLVSTLRESRAPPIGFLVKRRSEVTRFVILDNAQREPPENSRLSRLMKGHFEFGAQREKLTHASQKLSLLPLLPSWDESYGNCTLRKRGWTVQERELAVRSVFYTSSQMIWECQRGQATEQNPAPKEYREAQRLFFPATSDKGLMLSKWYDEVEKYTQRKLSYRLDRLPAISGLAETFGIIAGLETYLAGLWEEDLLEGLLWTARRERSISYRVAGRRPAPTDYPGPSWSWASVSWPVEWWSRSLIKDWTKNPEVKPKILSATTIPDGSDPRGRLSRGCIQIEGVMKQVVPGPDNGPPKLFADKDVFIGVAEWDHDYLYASDRGYYIVPIYLAPSEWQGRHSLGLILTPTSESCEDYQRLGLADSLPTEPFLELPRQTISII